MNHFKNVFNELIKGSSKTQKEIAQDLNITPAQICHFKTGYNEPNIDMLIKIADYFDISTDELIGHDITYKEGQSKYDIHHNNINTMNLK